MNSTLSKRSLNQDINGFSDGYATFSQFCGTALFNILKYIESNSYDITTRPFIAFYNSSNDSLITTSSLLNLATSYKSTVDKLSIKPFSFVLNRSFLQLLISNNSGSYFSSSIANSITISSELLPPDPAINLGYIDKIVDIILSLSYD
jgi:hypothetical protein